VRNKFGFLWMSWFFWFLLLALVYVPFGAQLNVFLQDIPVLAWATTYDWQPGVPALDSSFVTPLVVTQLLNLFLKHYLPYWMRLKKHRIADQYFFKRAGRGSVDGGGGGGGSSFRLLTRARAAPAQPAPERVFTWRKGFHFAEDDGDGADQEAQPGRSTPRAAPPQPSPVTRFSWQRGWHFVDKPAKGAVGGRHRAPGDGYRKVARRPLPPPAEGAAAPGGPSAPAAVAPPHPPAAPEASSAAWLEPGSRVAVYGLQSHAAQHRNGQRGRLQAFDAGTGRYTVQLDEGSTLALRPENLACGDAGGGGREVDAAAASTTAAAAAAAEAGRAAAVAATAEAARVKACRAAERAWREAEGLARRPGGLAADQLQPAAVATLARRMRQDLDIRDRTLLLKTHKACFTGREAVLWLRSAGGGGQRSEAIALAVGTRLLDDGLIEPCWRAKGKGKDKDKGKGRGGRGQPPAVTLRCEGSLFYRFVEQETAAHRLVDELKRRQQSTWSAAALVEHAEERSRWAVRAHSGDSNRISSVEVVRQSQLPEFSCFDAYLAIVIQFSYITMFTVVWPLAGVCAVGNNWFVFRAQVFSLLRSHRRGVPARVGDEGIGEWGNIMLLQIAIAAVVVSALIVLSTGQLEHWLCSDADMQQIVDSVRVGPNFACKIFHEGGASNKSFRLNAFGALEHVSVLLIAVVWKVRIHPTAL
jgi:hypothetical protein